MKERFKKILKESLEKMSKEPRYCAYCLEGPPFAFNLLLPEDSEMGDGVCSVCEYSERDTDHGYTLGGGMLLLKDWFANSLLNEEIAMKQVNRSRERCKELSKAMKKAKELQESRTSNHKYTNDNT